MSIQSENITLRDGRIICAPDNPKLMTNYVLKEQGEWFEDEIQFVQKLIVPGMNVLDIGANYGLYSSKIAQCLKGDGKLWCFEPTPDTAQCLRTTLELNAFNNVAEVIELGLSESPGEATFYLSDNAELNSLIETDASQRKITITLDTLDSIAADRNISNVSFVKLDAEGEEIKILKGARQFFSQNDALVMFELKHGDQINTGLIEAFEALGMQSFRYVPGLGALVPFDKASAPDGYLLNLFAANENCIEQLVERGVLITQQQIDESQLPYDRPIPGDLHGSGLSLQGGDYYEQVLGCYALGINASSELSVRFRAMQTALSLIVEKLDKDVEVRPERLSGIAAIAFAAGARSLGVSALNVLIENYVLKGVPFQVEEPFVLLASDSFSGSDADNRVMLVANAVESWLKMHAFSTIFSDPARTKAYLDFLGKINMQSSYAVNLSTLLDKFLAS